MNVQQRASEILETLQVYSSQKSIEGMARFGINTEKAYGIAIPVLRNLAKEIGIDHMLAKRLWISDIHEARILASMIADANQMTPQDMDSWVKEFDSWDVCDQTCMNLFSRTAYAYEKVREWSARDEEFVRRAGFALMAVLAVHDKKASDEIFVPFLRLIILHATDERNFVKKSVNWALRQIGKRNSALNVRAKHVALELKSHNKKTARWIGSDALRELESDAIQKRLLFK